MSSDVEIMTCEEKTKAAVAGSLSMIRAAMRGEMLSVEDLSWLSNELGLLKSELRVIQGYDVEQQ